MLRCFNDQRRKCGGPTGDHIHIFGHLLKLEEFWGGEGFKVLKQVSYQTFIEEYQRALMEKLKNRIQFKPFS